MYPLRFDRIYQTYVWGIESWELSDRPEGMSVVANGPYKGVTLQNLVNLWGEQLLGKGCIKAQFPLLIKTISAQENLSIQVHPNEKSAAVFKGESKSESWIMLEEGRVYAGLKKGVTQSVFLEAVQKNALKELVEFMEVRAGDVFFIPAGLVHAVGAGSFLLEVQQNSNTTYRLYDWGRGFRKLHIEEGIASIDWSQDQKSRVRPKTISTDRHHQLESLVESPCFNIERLRVMGRWNGLVDKKSFQILFCQAGEGIVSANGFSEKLLPNTTYLIPAFIENLDIEGDCKLIRVKM